jgi:tRNA threonylcarbamoyladenosine biosynthesis protein TsaB
LIKDDRLVAEMLTTRKETHSKHLMPMIQAVMGAAGRELSDIDALAVVRGPGSFTGLRIGLSVVKGLAASAAKPVVGVSSLEALAFPVAAPQTLVCAMVDARKNEVYTARFRRVAGRLSQEAPTTVGPPRDALADIDEACVLVGNGALQYAEIIRTQLGQAAHLAPWGTHLIRASNAAWLGQARLRNGRGDDLLRLAPEYIRPSDAQIHMARNPQRSGT